MAVIVAGAGVSGEDGATAHFEDTVEAAEVGWVVRGHQDRESRAGLEEETVDDLTARLVEGCVRLVEQEDFRALDDRPGDERALSLAAGKRLDGTLRELRQAELGQGAVDGFVAMVALFEPAMMGVGTHLDQAT